MGAPHPKFEVVEEPDQTQDIKSDVAVSALMLALRGLSQRAAIALSNLFCLLTVSSAFWLCLSIHDPSTPQLIMLGGYFSFVLAANWIVRRR